MQENHIFYLPIKNINYLGKENFALLIKIVISSKFHLHLPQYS